MPESFGARMRQHRERQQISLTTIAEQTKIKLSLLESMEQGDVSRWPSGIFRRAFMRSYARVIGLEPDVVVREFLDEHPDPVEEALTGAVEIAADGDGARATTSAPPTRLRYVVRRLPSHICRVGAWKWAIRQPSVLLRFRRHRPSSSRRPWTRLYQLRKCGVSRRRQLTRWFTTRW